MYSTPCISFKRFLLQVFPRFPLYLIAASEETLMNEIQPDLRMNSRMWMINRVEGSLKYPQRLLKAIKTMVAKLSTYTLSQTDQRRWNKFSTECDAFMVLKDQNWYRPRKLLGHYIMCPDRVLTPYIRRHKLHSKK